MSKRCWLHLAQTTDLVTYRPYTGAGAGRGWAAGETGPLRGLTIFINAMRVDGPSVVKSSDFHKDLEIQISR